MRAQLQRIDSLLARAYRHLTGSEREAEESEKPTSSHSLGPADSDTQVDANQNLTATPHPF